MGSYFVMRGISAFAGGFPPAFELIQQYKSGVVTSVSPTYYGYLAGMLVLSVIGSFVQWHFYKKMGYVEKHPYFM